MAELTRATIASDEDQERAFVLVDDAAPTAEAAVEAFLAQVEDEWSIRFDAAELDEIREAPVHRRSYKIAEDGESLTVCEPDDPERDSEWWSFDLPPGGGELIVGGRRASSPEGGE